MGGASLGGTRLLFWSPIATEKILFSEPTGPVCRLRQRWYRGLFVVKFPRSYCHDQSTGVKNRPCICTVIHMVKDPLWSNGKNFAVVSIADLAKLAHGENPQPDDDESRLASGEMIDG